MRHRLLSTTGGSNVEHVYGVDEARQRAEERHAASGVPVLVCEAPEGGIVRVLYTVGADKRNVRR